MPRKGYTRHTPKNLLKIGNEVLYFVPISTNGKGYQGETLASKELGKIIDVLGNLKHHYIAIDLDALRGGSYDINKQG